VDLAEFLRLTHALVVQRRLLREFPMDAARERLNEDALRVVREEVLLLDVPPALAAALRDDDAVRRA